MDTAEAEEHREAKRQRSEQRDQRELAVEVIAPCADAHREILEQLDEEQDRKGDWESRPVGECARQRVEQESESRCDAEKCQEPPAPTGEELQRTVFLYERAEAELLPGPVYFLLEILSG
ncbi:hypothetical protein R9C00_23315 [Flammeovirgaceae bacterium SG7u.111]|nr:hypothetical protein [Flammeovirgaceae bacterium SG7u.132]WPO34636.1 hypothetical protein R9C00_23315 [Flammeovirgaceae bacterium SG7u.111]